MVNVPHGARRLFHLERDEDESGVSGTGVVAEGVEFTNGMVVVIWLSHTPSINTYFNIKNLDQIHRHGGKTRVVIDYEEQPLDKQESEEEDAGS